MKVRLLIASLVYMVMIGCSWPISPPTESRSYFVLQTKPFELGGKTLVSIPATILVRDTRAVPFINGRKIVFARSDISRGYYQFASWAVPPPRAFTDILVEKLEEATIFQSVARQSSAVSFEYQLNTEIAEFYHGITNAPGEVVISVNVELVDFEQRRIIGKKVFERSEPAESFDVQGAVIGFERATNVLVDELIFWISEILAQQHRETDGSSSKEKE